MDQMTEMQTTVHEYRKALDAFEARTGHASQTVAHRGSGEEREKIDRMDSDLSLIEARAEAASMRARIAKLEGQPMFQSAAPSSMSGGDINDRGSEAYAKRWLGAVVRGDSAELRQLSLSSSGAAIPTDLERRIVTKMQSANVLRMMANVSTIDSKRTITVENALPTSALVAENGSISASDPTFSTAISVVPYKYVCATQMSQEFIEDAIGTSGIGTGLQYVADRIGLSLGLKTEEAFTVGTGSAQPQGICVTAAVTAGGTAANLAAVTGDLIIDAVHTVPLQYRNSPKFSWLMSDGFLKTVRKLKVNTTDYIWKPGGDSGLVGGAPATIYGVPYRLGAYVPATGIAAVVGDFSYFEIFDRSGMTSLMDPYTAAGTNKTTLYSYIRTDSHSMLPAAFAGFTVTA